ncbi:MAG: PQQ-dependent sugar dehydrogenase [Ignavibacterium sp.]|nr:PQQ-dependent sugar dehydrogenase [Ignavibacterium sp.]
MFIRIAIPIFVLALLFSSLTSAQYSAQEAFPNLPNFSGPVDLRNSNDCTNRLFVIEQIGRIRVFDNRPDVNSYKTFLDITDRVSSGGEMGLLGLDFHPDYKNNGYFYVNYTADNPRRTIISRFQVSATNPDSASGSSEFELLNFSQPYSNHNGGWIGFGPDDGYLYIATGDGGSGGDPQNNSQTITNLLGKILRIDVDNQDPGLNYAIPVDNPFVDSSGSVRKEIYAWGLRNPWRCSFDPVTGWLWSADVGQSAREEINVIDNGGNYGWRCYEGNLPYNTSGCLPASNYIFPVYDYPHTVGYSVTGGYVYRGPNQPGLDGKYVYADWGSRNVWAITYDGINPATNQQLFTLPSGSPTSFGVDEAGELYIVGGTRIRKIIPTAPIIAPSTLTAEATDPAIVELNWIDNSNNEDGFRIERADDGAPFQLVATVPSGTNSYVDTVSVLGDFQYRVNAFNSSDQSGFTNVACVSVLVVPVEMSLFTVEINANGDYVTLRWETASELNNSGFEVERKLSNNNYEKIGFVEGKGTTTENSVYSLVDNYNNAGFSGTIYYRLKQLDYDGSFSYSGPVSVNVELTAKDYFIEQNFPNPFNPSTSVRFNLPEESRVSVQVINSLGEVIADLVDEIKPSGIYSQTWNAVNAASGIYFIRINAQSVASNKTFSQTIKSVLMK